MVIVFYWPWICNIFRKTIHVRHIFFVWHSQMKYLARKQKKLIWLWNLDESGAETKATVHSSIWLEAVSKNDLPQKWGLHASPHVEHIVLSIYIQIWNVFIHILIFWYSLKSTTISRYHWLNFQPCQCTLVQKIGLQCVLVWDFS